MLWLPSFNSYPSPLSSISTNFLATLIGTKLIPEVQNPTNESDSMMEMTPLDTADSLTDKHGVIKRKSALRPSLSTLECKSVEK